MDRQRLALDWEHLNHRPGIARLPTFVFLKRDCLWLLIVLGLIATWLVDRSRAGRHHDTFSSALVEARAAAEQARRQEILVSEQLCRVQESREALAVRHQEDEVAIAKLSRDISALQADMQSSPVSLYASGRER